jgi:beta-xylosidase
VHQDESRSHAGDAAFISTATVASQLPWRDTSLPASARVSDLLARMSLEEKVAQLYGVWVGADASGDGVAPHQHDLAVAAVDWNSLVNRGLGQLTRPFGTAPVDPALGARALARTQAEIVAAGRHGIPALAHEECLTGFMTWGATIYPTPLAWGATFDPGVIEAMAAQVGAAMRSVGVHQGLAPVLDVARDYRWGRVEETIGEDPYLVATIGTAYVRGLESAGIVATLKHFVGYSGSRSGRNFGPVCAGAREIADVLLPPFEMAIREGGARSVMHAYTEIDAVPVAASHDLLTTLLREEWGFEGTVVADYFGISFLHLLHGVAGSETEAAALAIAAGVDVELPTVHCYGAPLLDAVDDGRVSPEHIDRAARRVLTQKCELGLLDPNWRAEPPALIDLEHGLDGDIDAARGSLLLDTEASRALARRIAEESVVLVANSGVRPARASRSSAHARTIRSRCWAATPFPATSEASIRRCPLAWRYRRYSRPCASSCPPRRRTMPAVATSPPLTLPDSRRRPNLPVRPTSAWSRSETAPACSAAARPAKAVTSMTCNCPAFKANSSTSY